VAAAPKKVASRYYQLKVGHAAVGTYLRRIGAQETDVCRWCAAPKESVYHLLFECRQWWSQRTITYRTFEKDKVLKPMPREEEPEARIFENRRASGALLQFLRQTEVGCAKGETKRIAERENRDDEWDLENLEEAEGEESDESDG
jgi:hypothetical protein